MFKVILDYFRSFGAQLGKGWNRFWFTPSDPFSLGAMRILVGLFALYTLWCFNQDLQALLTDRGFLPEKTLHAVLQASQPDADQPRLSLSYWDFPIAEDAASRWALHLAGMAVVALFTVGFYTRITSVLAFVVVVSYFQRILLITTELDAILTALMFYLCLAPSGAALSVDAFFADRKRWKATLSNKAKQALPPLVQPSVSTMIATRLLQVHLTAICLMMAIGKLMAGVWWNGDAAWLLIAKTQNNLFDLTWMHAYGPVLDAWTHFIVWTQCVFPFLVWNKTARPLMLAVASLMWLSLIPLTGMVEFSLLMIAANLAFVSPVALRKFVDLLTGEARMTVVYDGLCPLCRNSASAIKALDVCDAIKLADFNREDPKELHPELTLDKCMRSMFVIEGERLSEGYDGFTRIARGLPTLWPAAWLTFLPGVASLGRPLYRRVADARARNASCDEGTCHVGSGPAARSNEKQEREISV